MKPITPVESYAVINALARLPMAKSKRSKYEDDELMML